MSKTAILITLLVGLTATLSQANPLHNIPKESCELGTETDTETTTEPLEGCPGVIQITTVVTTISKFQQRDLVFGKGANSAISPVPKQSCDLGTETWTETSTKPLEGCPGVYISTSITTTISTVNGRENKIVPRAPKESCELGTETDTETTTEPLEGCPGVIEITTVVTTISKFQQRDLVFGKGSAISPVPKQSCDLGTETWTETSTKPLEGCPGVYISTSITTTISRVNGRENKIVPRAPKESCELGTETDTETTTEPLEGCPGVIQITTVVTTISKFQQRDLVFGKGANSAISPVPKQSCDLGTETWTETSTKPLEGCPGVYISTSITTTISTVNGK